jgi:transcriptional regulator with XRE-family HTH domain
MPSEYAKTLGARLRAIRTQQGLSLHGVEEKSRGRWKAVVVGSYERGDRSVTVQKLAELAEFYGVPVSELLPGDAAPTDHRTEPPTGWLGKRADAAAVTTACELNPPAQGLPTRRSPGSRRMGHCGA